ncbi:Lipase (class 3) [Botrimarina colliarenosi]|uniref:Lipase (Class 3) n=1 Tax=Botrimarina colliarenosi TaxID=2528001 RepID=A0A5C6A9D3_9BACT|nr:lipase family protein [Botrimarina colliarenosi]TWT95957.1 Lipase (class 3) [Botrimarina colliarenosi]
MSLSPSENSIVKDVKPLEVGESLKAITRLEGRTISQLTFLEKSLLFAELSRASYFPRTIAGKLAEEIGLPEIRFYDRDGAQAYIFGADEDAVVCCRGTEPNEWNDIRADLDALTDAAETVGRVHRGFKREVDDLWPRLEQALVSNERVLWFAGHSLGGAMTAICAGRCYLSHIKSTPEAVYTFGSPRVGNRAYVNHVELAYYRWVNNNDIVPRVPPNWLGYRHGGHEVYLNRRGRISGVTGLLRARDHWWGFWRTLRKWRIDHFADHLMGEYIKAIENAVIQEREGNRPPALERLLKKIGCPSVMQQAPPAPHIHAESRVGTSV